MRRVVAVPKERVAKKAPADNRLASKFIDR
jgi:hypothetical protein